MSDNIFCGVNRIPKGKQLGTARQCANKKQIRYYGLVKVEKDILKKQVDLAVTLLDESIKMRKLNDKAKILIREIKKYEIIEQESKKMSEQRQATKKLGDLLETRDKLITKIKNQQKVIKKLNKQISEEIPTKKIRDRVSKEIEELVAREAKINLTTIKKKQGSKTSKKKK